MPAGRLVIPSETPPSTSRMHAPLASHRRGGRLRPPVPVRPVGDGVLDVPFRAVLVLRCRGGRLCPPCMTAAPCRAGPVCPAGSNAYAAAGHMGPALQGRCVDAVPYTFNSSGHKSPVKITTIPHRILCTYPKCENFPGNGCERSSKVLYLTHTS